MSDYPITAFPTTEAHWINENARTEGMMLRDYFAAKAFAAVIGSLNGPVTGEEYPGDFDHYAECSYRMADAMLRARGR
ncbi:MAG: hypothetical protein ACJ8LD_10560 [Pantoea agglomerans]